MSAAHTLTPPLDVALRKVVAGELLSLDERKLVERRLDDLTSADDLRRRLELRAATERLHALGVEGEVVVTGTADDLIAYLDATEPTCAPPP